LCLSLEYIAVLLVSFDSVSLSLDVYLVVPAVVCFLALDLILSSEDGSSYSKSDNCLSVAVPSLLAEDDGLGLV
jgi:hypothetical protein